ncbi:hypothetical protein JCM6882_004825 [Rhodosporidiobolus microsporus]
MPKSDAPDYDPQRPFSCPECGSRYTRQEHLDRHVTAKHRVAKDFVCPICHKGFARKDILKRHQAGHEKQAQAAQEALARGELADDDDRRSVGSASKPKKKRPVVQTNSDIAVEDGGGPVKIARVGRACCRCSKSKLRCDGQHPCERCRKAGIECSFDRPAKGPPSRSGSVSMMLGDEPLHTPSMESDGETTSPENAFSLPALPTPPPPDQWGRQLNSAVAQASMSLYNMPLRGAPSHHAHALPPNSFIQGNPPPVNYYSGRPPESFSYHRHTSPYHQPPPSFASASLPHHNPSPLNPYAQSNLSALGSLPAAAAASSSSQWDNSAYGRQIGGEGESSNNDFFNLVTGGGGAGSGTGDDGIDWSILSSGFANDPMLNGVQASLRTGFTPRDGMSPAPTGGTVDLGLLTAALGAPAQPVSDLRNGASAADDGGAVASNSGSLPFPEDESAIDDDEDDDLPENPPIPVRTNSIVESDRAAVSLLQLASHTPRVSPEPGDPPSSSAAPTAGGAPRIPSSATKPSFPRGHFSLLNPATEEALRTSHPTHSPSAHSADPWPLSYRPTEPLEEILPASARGTGYFSRAASVPPGEFPPPKLDHVPSVTEATRLRILYKVKEHGSGDPGLSERFVPRLELLELFVQLYFDKYHALVPLVHKPTWDPNTAPSFLVLAVASVGARYAHERVVGASMHAHALLECARRLMQVMGDADNTLLRTVAWQQCLLVVLQSGIFSGNKRDLERTQAFASMPVTFARRQGWLRDPKVDPAAEELLPLDERWKRWRNREEIRRLGFGAVVFDCAATALWNLECLSLYLDAANTALPCHDALWDAPTAQAWSTLFRHLPLPSPSPTLSHAIHLVCSSPSSTSSSSSSTPDALTPILRDHFALATVLNVLNALGWERGHARAVERTFLGGLGGVGGGVKKEEEMVNGVDGEGEKEGEDAARAALEAGVEFYQDRILLPASLLAKLPEDGQGQTPTGGTTMALFVHLTALVSELPLRVLQPLARTPLGPLPPSTTAALRAWALSSHGSVARKTVYHAGQLLALCRPASSSTSSSVGAGGGSGGGSEGPIEPFAIFYAALALWAFIREGGGGAGDKSAAESEAAQELELDVLRDRSDGDIQAWIHSGPLGAPFSSGGAVPSLRLFPAPPPSSAAHEERRPPPPSVGSSVRGTSLVRGSGGRALSSSPAPGAVSIASSALPALPVTPGAGAGPSFSAAQAQAQSQATTRLSSPRAAEMVLASCARRLGQLKVWKVGENLGSVLEGLAGREKGVVLGGAAGNGGGGGGYGSRGGSAAGSVNGSAQGGDVKMEGV